MSVRSLIEAAIKDRGSEAKLAAACGVSQAAIWKAKKAGRVSPRLAIKMEGACGISRRLLCPEIFETTAANGDTPPEPRVA
ncbi:YdaS family helix-turn-helix protein [Methylobacterium oxalidis]